MQIHVATVLPAFALGTWLIFFSVKGRTLHRALGYAYLSLMTATSIAAMFIHRANPNGLLGLSWIHLFVPLTLWGVFSALRGAWTHDIPGHRGAMMGLYFGGLLIAGALSFLPGRIMHQVAFGLLGPARDLVEEQNG